MPPGWPREVPPPAVEGWQHRAVAWLLDVCPPDYRRYDAWVHHPVALAWLATRHLDGQVAAMRQALSGVLLTLEREGLRLVSARRSAGQLLDALEGKDYVPRL